MTLMDISHARNFTPSSFASSIISFGRFTFFCFMMRFINQRPIPNMFSLEGPIASPPRASRLNIFPMNPSPLKKPPFLMTFNPQNVKNKVTSMLEAAAPVAITRAAMALSRSPLNTTIEAFPTLSPDFYEIRGEGAVIF